MNAIRRQIALLVCAGWMLAASARAQSTAFSYQGKLNNGGTPAAGVHDFRFRLFDDATAGLQVGAQLCIDNLAVNDGVFTATLDFLNQFITSTPRFLEIDVRVDSGLNCGNAAGFQTLAQRQPIVAVPLAMQAHSAFSLASFDGNPAVAVFVDHAGNVGVGTFAPQAKLDVDSGDLHLGLPTNGWYFHTRSSFGGDFMQVTDTVSGAPQFQHGVVLTKLGRVGIGTTAPQAALDARGDIRLGASGQLFATGGQENLRIIRGIVSANGTIIGGSGFTVSRTGAGQYTITFTTPFPSPPAVTATTNFNGSASSVIQTNGVTGSSAAFYISTNSTPVNADDAFHFIAVGPR